MSRPLDVDEVAAAVCGAAARGVLARGLGRSYGDAAQNAGGTVLDLTGLDRVLAVDGTAGTVVAEAGLSLDRLLRVLLPAGWFVPVTPGTRYVTLGGALAADVHGKNHHVDGSLAQHVDWVDLVLADGTVRRVSARAEPDLFWATAGGMGLTGVVVRLQLRLVPVASSWMLVDTKRADGLDSLLDLVVAGDQHTRYSVAWVDCLATGRRFGRGVVTSGDHAPAAAVPAGVDPLDYHPHPRLTVPPVVPSGVLSSQTVRAFNEAWFRAAPGQRTAQPQAIPTFFHPLDGVRSWNRAYGPAGFVQYQFVVPPARTDVLHQVLSHLQRASAPAFLAVLKRFGGATPGPLAFPRPGWTLAVDLPSSVPGLAGLLDRLDEMVVEAGGAVYLAKDSRLRPELLPPMYPRLDDFRAVRARVDPDDRFRSDLARRLAL